MTDSCNATLGDQVAVTIGGFCTLPPKNVEALRSAISYQVSRGVKRAPAVWCYLPLGVTYLWELSTSGSYLPLGVIYLCVLPTSGSYLPLRVT